MKDIFDEVRDLLPPDDGNMDPGVIQVHECIDSLGKTFGLSPSQIIAGSIDLLSSKAVETKVPDADDRERITSELSNRLLDVLKNFRYTS